MSALNKTQPNKSCVFPSAFRPGASRRSIKRLQWPAVPARVMGSGLDGLLPKLLL
jgi:hypothetical protein